jgi:hypothetical protein
MESTKKLTFFPPLNGLPPYYSPRMIIHQENLDFHKKLYDTFWDLHPSP